MSKMAVKFYSEDTAFQIKSGKRKISAWFRSATEEEGFRPGDLNIIFCSDGYLLGMNRKFLQHDYLTDIITFDYGEEMILSGDLFISVDRVRENSVAFGVMFHVELFRVMIHGIMHLAGYKDKTIQEEQQMREREDHYLETAPEGVKFSV